MASQRRGRTAARPAWLSEMDPHRTIDNRQLTKKELLMKIGFNRQLPAAFMRRDALAKLAVETSPSTSSVSDSTGSECKPDSKKPKETATHTIKPIQRPDAGKEIVNNIRKRRSLTPQRNKRRRPRVTNVIRITPELVSRIVPEKPSKAPKNMSNVVGDGAVVGAAGVRDFGMKIADTLLKNMSSVADPKFPYVMRKSLNDCFLRRQSEVHVLDCRPKTIEDFQRATEEYDLIPIKAAKMAGVQPGIVKVKRRVPSLRPTTTTPVSQKRNRRSLSHQMGDSPNLDSRSPPNPTPSSYSTPTPQRPRTPDNSTSPSDGLIRIRHRSDGVMRAASSGDVRRIRVRTTVDEDQFSDDVLTSTDEESDDFSDERAHSPSISRSALHRLARRKGGNLTSSSTCTTSCDSHLNLTRSTAGSSARQSSPTYSTSSSSSDSVIYRRQRRRSGSRHHRHRRGWSSSRPKLPTSYDSLLRLDVERRRSSATHILSTSTDFSDHERQNAKKPEREASGSTVSEPIEPPDDREARRRKKKKAREKGREEYRRKMRHQQAMALAQQTVIAEMFRTASEEYLQPKKMISVTKRLVSDSEAKRRHGHRKRPISALRYAKTIQKPIPLQNFTASSPRVDIPIHKLISESRRKAAVMKSHRKLEASMDASYASGAVSSSKDARITHSETRNVHHDHRNKPVTEKDKSQSSGQKTTASENLSDPFFKMFGYSPAKSGTPSAAGKSANSKVAKYPSRARFPQTTPPSQTYILPQEASKASPCVEGQLCSPHQMNLDSNDQVWLPDVAPLDKKTSQRPAPPPPTNRQDPISDKVVDDAAKILPGVLRHSKTPSFFYENYAPVGDNRIPTGMGKSRSDRAESEPLARRLSKRISRSISRVCLRGRQWRHAHDMTDTTATDPSPIDTKSVPKSDDHSGDLPRKESLTQRMRKSVDLLLRRNRNREQDQELPTPPPSPPPPKHEPVTVPLTTTMHAAGKSAGKTGRPLVSGPVYGTFVDSRVEGFHGPSPYALHPEVGHAMAQPDMISLPAGQREVAPLAKFFIYPTTAKSSASLTAKSRTSTNWSTAKIAPNDSVASSRRLSKRQSSQNIVNLSEKPSQLTTPGKRRKSSAASSRKMSLEGSRRLSKRQSFQNVSENPTRGEEVATASIRRKSSTASSKKVSMESSRRPSKRQSVQNIPSNSWPEERGTSSISHVQRTHGKQRKSSKNVSRDESRKISQRQSVSNLPEKSLSSGFTPSNKSPMMLGSTTVPRTPAEPPPSILSEAKSKPLSTVEELDEFLFNTFSPTIDTKSTSRIDSRSSKIPVKKPSAVFKNPSQPPTPIQKLMRLSRIDLSASSSADTSSRREKPDSPATSEKKLTWSKQISLEVSPRGSQVDLKSERSQKNDGIKKDSDLGALQSGIGSDISVKASKTKWPDGSLKGSKIPSLTQSFQNDEKESSAKISAVSSRNRSKEKVSAKKSSEKYSYELPSPRRLESIPQSPFTMGSKKSTQNSAIDSATRKPGFPQQTGTGFQPEKLDTLVTIPNEPLIKHPKKSKSSSRVASATRTPRKFSETSKNTIAEMPSIKSNKESTPGSRMSRRQSAEKLRIKSRGNSSAPSSRMSRQYSEDKFHDLRKLDSVNSSKEASRKHSGKIVAPPEPNVFVKISPRKDSLLHLPPRPSDTIPSQEAIPVINTITKSKSARNSLENLGSSAKSIASNSDVSTAALYVARMSKEGKTHQQPDPKSKLTAAKVRDIIQAKLSKTPLKNPLATSKAQREDILNKIESIIQDSGADNTVESPAGFIGQQLSTNEPTIMTMSKKNSPTSGKHLDKRNKPSLDVFQVEPTENRGSRKQEPVPSVLPTEASAQNPKAAGLRKTAKQRPLNTQNMQAPSSVRESRKWRHSHLGLTNAQWNPMTPINANLTKVKLSKKKQPSILKQMRDVEKRLEAQKPHRYNVNRYQHTPKPPPQPVATIAAQQQSRSIPTSTDTTFVTAHPMTLGARDHITQMHTAHRRGSARRPSRPGDIFSAAINSVPRNAPLPKPASFMKGNKMPTATTLVTVPVKKSDSPTHLDAVGRRRKSHNQQGFRQKHLQSQGFNVLARTMTPCQRAKLRRMHEARQKHGRQSLVTKTLYGHDDDDEYAVRHKTGSDTHLKSSASTSKKVRASLKNIALTHPSKKKASHHQLVPDDEDILTNTHQSADSENHNKTNDVTNPFNKRRPSGSHEDLQMLEILPLVGKKLETPSDTVVSRRGKGLKRVKKIAPVPVLPSLTSISEDNQEEKTVRHYISEGVSAATNFNTSYAPSAMISAAIQRMSPPTASSYTLQQIVTKVSAVDQDSNVTRQTGSGESAEKSSPASPSTSESQYSLSLGLKDKPEHRDELESESVLTEKMVQKMIKSASKEQTDAHESLKSPKRDAFKHSEDKKRSSKNYSNMSHNIQRILREAQREAVKPLRPKEPRREKPVSKRVSRTPSAIANRRRNSSNKPEEKLSRKPAKEIPRREFKGKSHSRTRLRNSKQVTRKSSRHSVRKSVSRSRASSSIDPRIYSSVDKFYKGLVAAKAALGPAYSNLIKASIHVGENTGSRTRSRSSSIRHRRGSSSSTDDSKQPRLQTDITTDPFVDIALSPPRSPRFRRDSITGRFGKSVKPRKHDTYDDRIQVDYGRKRRMDEMEDRQEKIRARSPSVRSLKPTRSGKFSKTDILIEGKTKDKPFPDFGKKSPLKQGTYNHIAQKVTPKSANPTERSKMIPKSSRIEQPRQKTVANSVKESSKTRMEPPASSGMSMMDQIRRYVQFPNPTSIFSWGQTTSTPRTNPRNSSSSSPSLSVTEVLTSPKSPEFRNVRAGENRQCDTLPCYASTDGFSVDTRRHADDDGLFDGKRGVSSLTTTSCTTIDALSEAGENRSESGKDDLRGNNDRLKNEYPEKRRRRHKKSSSSSQEVSVEDKPVPQHPPTFDYQAAARRIIEAIREDELKRKGALLSKLNPHDAGTVLTSTDAFNQTTQMPQDEPDFLVVGKDTDVVTPSLDKFIASKPRKLTRRRRKKRSVSANNSKTEVTSNTVSKPVTEQDKTATASMQNSQVPSAMATVSESSAFGRQATPSKRLSANPNQLMGNTSDILETMVAQTVAADEAAAEILVPKRKLRSKKRIPAGLPGLSTGRYGRQKSSGVSPGPRGTYMSLEPGSTDDKVPRKWNRVDLANVATHPPPPPPQHKRPLKRVFRWKDNSKTRRSARRLSSYTSKFRKMPTIDVGLSSRESEERTAKENPEIVTDANEVPAAVQQAEPPKTAEPPMSSQTTPFESPVTVMTTPITASMAEERPATQPTNNTLQVTEKQREELRPTSSQSSSASTKGGNIEDASSSDTESDATASKFINFPDTLRKSIFKRLGGGSFAESSSTNSTSEAASSNPGDFSGTDYYTSSSTSIHLQKFPARRFAGGEDKVSPKSASSRRSVNIAPSVTFKTPEELGGGPKSKWTRSKTPKRGILKTTDLISEVADSCYDSKNYKKPVWESDDFESTSEDESTCSEENTSEESSDFSSEQSRTTATVTTSNASEDNVVNMKQVLDKKQIVHFKQESTPSIKNRQRKQSSQMSVRMSSSSRLAANLQSRRSKQAKRIRIVVSRNFECENPRRMAQSSAAPTPSAIKPRNWSDVGRGADFTDPGILCRGEDGPEFLEMVRQAYESFQKFRERSRDRTDTNNNNHNGFSISPKPIVPAVLPAPKPLPPSREDARQVAASGVASATPRNRNNNNNGKLRKRKTSPQEAAPPPPTPEPQKPIFTSIGDYFNNLTDTAKGQLESTGVPNLFKRLLLAPTSTTSAAATYSTAPKIPPETVLETNMCRDLAGGNPPATAATSLQPRPSVSDVECSLNDGQLSDRIINEFPFGSPGELPTTMGGMLDPDHMPRKQAELLPSLSLAASGARSPRKAFKNGGKGHGRCQSNSMNLHRSTSKQIINLASSISETFMKNAVNLDIFPRAPTTQRTTHASEPRPPASERFIAKNAQPSRPRARSEIRNTQPKSMPPLPNRNQWELPVDPRLLEEVNNPPSPPRNIPIKGRPNTQNTNNRPVVGNIYQHPVSDEASSTAYVGGIHKNGEYTPGPTTGITARRGQLLAASPPRLGSISATNPQHSDQSSSQQKPSKPRPLPPDNNNNNNNPRTPSLRRPLEQQPKVPTPIEATIEQLKAGLSQLTKQNATLASQVWQELGAAFLQPAQKQQTATQINNGHTPVTKEELERELAKVKLLTEKRLAEFLERNSLCSR